MIHSDYKGLFEMATLQASGSMRASDLLSRQEKKFTLEMPANLHNQLKMIAAANRVTAKDLLLEAFKEYTIPKYTKGVPNE